MTSLLSYDEIDVLFSTIDQISLCSDPEYGNDISFADHDKESIATFDAASATWAACGRVERGAVEGSKFAIYRGAQAFRGQRRRDVIVVELSDGRTAIHGMDH